MFSLRRLLSKEDRFFNLLQASADEGKASVQSLARLLGSPSDSAGLKDFLDSRDKERQIGEAIDALLCESYATPLEREDIELLSRALYRIPKTIKKFAERYLLCAPRIRDVSFAEHVRMLGAATETVYQMVSGLKKGPNLSASKAHNDILQKIEGDADKMMVAELQQLYHGQYDTVTVVILKDLYELLERVFDRCRNVGNLVFGIVLKNS
jgi:uncharacterized protein Yka (UPF0111/DUF47 family)